MLKKMKKGTPHKGPKGIPSYDDFDAKGNFRSGAAMSAAETGAKTERQRADLRQAGVSPEEARDIRLAAIASGAGQRVNPGFFDSRNVIPRADVLAAKKAFPKAFRKTRGGGLFGFLGSGGIFGNLIRGLGRGLFGLGKKFNEPTYDMRRFSGLGLFEPSVNPNNLDIYNEFVDDDETTVSPNIIIPRAKPDTQGLLEVPGIPLTPFQKDIKKDDFEEGLPQDVIDNLMAFKPGSIKDRQLKQMYNIFQETGMENPNMRNLMQEDVEEGGPLSLQAEAYRMLSADGGMIGGGIMDAAGRQNYFLGKLVKKAKRAVKKIVRSPVGKLGLLAAGGLGLSKAGLLSKLVSGGKLTGLGQLALGAGISAAPLLFQEEEEEQPTGFTGSVGGQIDPRAYTDPQSVLFRAFRAEGGSMKEPVAKKTMPLLDMGGQEMDLRAEGGFVPIGRMEKADDVPARLSKNEFVFTADAVRNAGDGDVDKGAEVMYNMMKNLEAGGEVSEESQGLEGARNMFQTSKRLEEVL